MTTNPPALRFDRVLLLVLATALLLSTAGCYRPPQVAPVNLELISALRTAISTRNQQRLSECEREIQQRHAAGQLSAAERAAFDDLIALARNNDWETAESRVLRFQQRQRPTQEQIDALPKPKPKPGGAASS